MHVIAAEGRSYRASLFERAAGIARKYALKSEDEISQLMNFVQRVEEERISIMDEEDLGEIPDEFLGIIVSYFRYHRVLIDVLTGQSMLTLPKCIRHVTPYLLLGCGPRTEPGELGAKN